MSGANVSTSGHITSTSRGSRVGSSREQPQDDLAQHLHLARPPVAGVHLHAAVGRVERERGCRRVVGGERRLQPAEQGVRRGGARVVLHVSPPAPPAPAPAAARGRRATGWRAAGHGAGARSCPPPVVRRQGLAPRRPTGRARRGAATGGRRGARRAPPSTCSRARDSRLAPKTFTRSGRSSSTAPDRSWSQAASSTSATDGSSTRARSRRHSSACQRTSSSSATPSPRSSSPAAQARSICGPSVGVGVVQPGQLATRRAAAARGPRRRRRGAARGGRTTAASGVHASSSSTSGHTRRDGRQASTAPAGTTGARTSSTSVVTLGKRTFAQTPSAPRRTAQHVGEALGQPALDALGRHGDDVGGEGVGRRGPQHLREGGGEHGALSGAVDDEHVRLPPRRAGRQPSGGTAVFGRRQARLTVKPPCTCASAKNAAAG